MAKKSATGAWLKRKAKAQARRAWSAHQKKVKARRAGRRKLRKEKKAQRRTVRTTKRESKTNGKGEARGNFWSRHSLLADVRDWAQVSAHAALDRRDMRSGLITEAELEELERFESQEEWAREMRNRRREELRRQAAHRRDAAPGARLTMVYAKHGSAPGTVRHVGFRPPTARPSAKKGTPPAPFAPPNQRTVRRKRKDRVPQLVNHWQPMLQLNARRAMAADGDLSGAAQSVQSFAEQFPETRTQIHDHLGKLGEFGKAYSSAMETLRSVLAQGKGEDNPGLPPEVLQYLKPLEEVGAQIEQASMQTIAAWEDYFQDAIKAAQDEHTPSKQALTS